ncbi:alpha/beta hydrolase [Streptomyces sp. P1-3]|uniref:alpha/beta hydrolase n=1 Tax=Streptomyces sp. P1-3 TaxID=3421658 RepID=UPI003D367DF3
MSDFTKLFKLNVSDLEAAVSSWRTLASELSSTQTQYNTRVFAPLFPEWKGDSAESAMLYLRRLPEQLQAAHVYALLIIKVMDTTRFRMEQAQTDLRNAVRYAEEQFVVDDETGKVSLPTWLTEAENDPDAKALATTYTEALNGHQQRIDQAIKDAKKASGDGKWSLDQIHAEWLDEDDAVGRTKLATKDVLKGLGIKSKFPDDMSAKDAKEWWDASDKDERELLIAMYPKEVGAQDGLPAEARNKANRLYLNQALQPVYDPESDDSMTTDDFNTQQEGLRTLKDKLDAAEGAPKDKELYLLKVDPEGDGRAIVAMGNPDTADNTAVLVPGTNTELTKMGSQINRIDALQQAAEKSAPSETTSVISWLDYDPPAAGGGRFDFGIAGQDRARDGGDTLRDFTSGLRVAQGDRHGHLTVIGHSYGSTTVGAGAANEDGLGADEIVVAGSPGTTVREAKDLQIDPKHVYVAAADDDPIIKWAADLTLGVDPSRESFGAQRIKVDTSGHSGYWDFKDNGQPSESLMNQGRIIVGDAPTTTEPKREMPKGRDGRELGSLPVGPKW